MDTPFYRLSRISFWILIWTVNFHQAAELKLIGTHPTSALSGFPEVQTIKTFRGTLYLGYGDLSEFPAVTISSYDPVSNSFRAEFSAATDLIDVFRELNGTLYAPSSDPGFNDENRDYSYLTENGWRDASPWGALHVFDMGTADGSDLWMVGSKTVSESFISGPAVFRSTDQGRNWQDLSIPTTLVRYYWGFGLSGKFYVRDTVYEGTNGIRVAPAPYIGLRKPTAVGDDVAQFIVAAGATAIPPENQPSGTPNPLVTFDTVTWRTLRTAVVDFALSDANLLALERGSIWMGSSLRATGATWQRLAFTNVPLNCRAIEVHNGIVYVGDSAGRLWGGRLDGEPLAVETPTLVNALTDGFGAVTAVDGKIVAIGAPDHSGRLPLSGQVSIWEQNGGSDWQRTALINPPVESFSGWFGKDLALRSNLLAVVEAGRDTTRTLRGRSAQVHLFERSRQEWIRQVSLDVPFAESVALEEEWLAIGCGTEPGQARTRLQLYRIEREESGVGLQIRTNIFAELRGNLWKPKASAGLSGNLCVLASTGDTSFDGGPGQIHIFEKDHSDV
jgi:hypothetical protein